MAEQTEQTPPGRDLDVAVARAMGLGEQVKDRLPDYEYSVTYEGLGEMLDWLRGRGYKVTCHCYRDGKACADGVRADGHRVMGPLGETLPHAVALLVLEVARG